MKIYDILRHAAKIGASDIHLSANRLPRIRVNGSLTETGHELITDEALKHFVSDILTDDADAFFKNKEYDGAFEIETENAPVRFRVNFSLESGHIAAALRLIRRDPPTIDSLGLPQELKSIAMSKKGLFLVTGPTGSGKSTTMAAIINEANARRSAHIVTIEDPMEYIFESDKSLIHQREVGRDTNSFDNALMHVLRQDPDIIMIGELRDKITVSAALRAAETGHFVLSTLHTNGASSTIDRLINFFAGEEKQKSGEIASVLIGVFSQCLVPCRDGGRIAAYEYLCATDGVRNNIREGRSRMIDNAIQTGASCGMISLSNSLEALYKKGIISGETYREYMPK